MDYAQIPPGEVLDGRFEVRRLIKSGGMGAVYEVSDRLLGGKTFAVKQIRPSADPKEFCFPWFYLQVNIIVLLDHGLGVEVGQSFACRLASFAFTSTPLLSLSPSASPLPPLAPLASPLATTSPE